MAELIETERLSLRPFRLEDAVAAYTWLGDPIVMRYTPTGPDSSVQKTRDRLAGYATHQLRHGFSKWLVVERASGRPVGDAGLLVLEGEGWIELGFTASLRVLEKLGFRGERPDIVQGMPAICFTLQRRD